MHLSKRVIIASILLCTLSLFLGSSCQIGEDLGDGNYSSLEQALDTLPEGTVLARDIYISNPPAARNSFASVIVQRASDDDGYGYCTGFMIGPNIMATAGHCRPGFYDPQGLGYHKAVFQTQDESSVTMESFDCYRLFTSENDTDIALSYCEENDNLENPGDKYGYILSDDSPVYTNDDVYSIWANPVLDEQIIDQYKYLLLFTDGEVGNLAETAAYWNPSYTVGRPLCILTDESCNIDDDCDQICWEVSPSEKYCAHYNWSDQIQRAHDTDVTCAKGGSGSPQMWSGNHKLAFGPTTDVRRGALDWDEMLYYSWWPDANDDQDQDGIIDKKFCFRGTLPTSNDSILSSMFGLSGSNYRDQYIDYDMNNIIDIQEDIESIVGEGERDYYFPFFGDFRWSSKWISSNGSNAYINEDSEYMYIGKPNSNAIKMTLSAIPFDASNDYLIQFDTYWQSYGSGAYLKIKVKNFFGDWTQTIYPHSGWQRHSYFYNTRYFDYAFEFELYGSSHPKVKITQFIVHGKNATIDFDNFDNRRRWRNATSSSPIIPDGLFHSGDTGSNFAGYTTYYGNGIGHRGIVFVPNHTYQICYSVKKYDSSSSYGYMRVRDESNNQNIKTRYFVPTTTWTEYCDTFTVPSTAYISTFLIGDLYSTGKFLVDDIEVSYLY